MLDDGLQLQLLHSREMSGSKSKASNTPSCPVTHGGVATVASKLAKMAAASPDASNSTGLVEESLSTLSMSQRVSELEKRGASLREDMSALIQESVKPLRSLVDALRKTVNDFSIRLAAAESLTRENFERVTSTEKQ